MIEKPKLEKRQRVGQYGELVEELTPESEIKWAEYLRQKRIAEIALRRSNETTETTTAQRATCQR